MTALLARQGFPILHATCQAHHKDGMSLLVAKCVMLIVCRAAVGSQNGSVTDDGSSIEEEGHWVDRGNGTASTSGRCGLNIKGGHFKLKRLPIVGVLYIAVEHAWAGHSALWVELALCCKTVACLTMHGCMQVGCREHCPWAACGVGKESGELSVWLEDGAEVQQLLWSWKPGYCPWQSCPSQ